MLRLDFFVLYQYSIQLIRWDVPNIGTVWGDIIYNTYLNYSWIAVHGRYYITHLFFFFNFAFVCLRYPWNNFQFFLSIYVLWILHSNKIWLSQHFPVFNTLKLLLLEHFYFVLPILNIYFMITDFWYYYHHYYYRYNYYHH